MNTEVRDRYFRALVGGSDVVYVCHVGGTGGDVDGDGERLIAYGLLHGGRVQPRTHEYSSARSTGAPLLVAENPTAVQVTAVEHETP